jgi:hypothetical protein
MNNFWNYTELSQIHVELTNACNAACPMCQRFLYGSTLTRPDLELEQITLEKFKKYFPPEIIKKTNLILFCGTQGDPCMAKDFYEICQYISDTSETTAVRVNTNGGMRNAEWWEKVGKLFGEHTEQVLSHWVMTFSIDGLEDTNHIYRRNVKWSKLMENVKAFIAGNGANKRTSWDYLIFEHNEHQIEEARKLAHDIGFQYFMPKKALGVDNGKSLSGMPALNGDGKLEYYINAPKLPENRNLENPEGEVVYGATEFDRAEYTEWRKAKKIEFVMQGVPINFDHRPLNKEELKNFDHYNSCEIKCKSAPWFPKGKEIFVDNFGYVAPCCYIGTHLNSVSGNSTTHQQLHHSLNDYGKDKFSLDKYSLEEILNQGHLNKVYADTWDKPSAYEGKMIFCSETCGTFSKIDKIYTHEGAERRAGRSVYTDKQPFCIIKEGEKK